ncbi:MAG: hypothetical protein KGL39_18570, partial [Patescibacteria group bacterium]|nr:hypothetical protein [Patescibacteria group bacterium]
ESAVPGGRPPKPLKVLEMSGATRKNPARYRARKAAGRLKLPPLGPPPEEWVKDAESNGRCAALLRIWSDIVSQDAACLRVLNASHRLLVKNTCQLQYKVDRAIAGFGKATSGDYAQIKSNLAAMGMTPVDSQRVAEAIRVPERGDAVSQRGGGGWGELVG